MTSRRLALIGRGIVLLLLAASARPASALPVSPPQDLVGGPAGSRVTATVENTGGTSNRDPTGGFCDESAGLTIKDAQLEARTDAFDNGLTLWVNDAIFPTLEPPFVRPAEAAVAFDKSDQTISTNFVTMTVGSSFLDVAMQYYMASDSSTIRTLADFHNPNTDTVTATVAWVTNVGGTSSDQQIRDSSDAPATTFNTLDRWVVTSDSAVTPTVPALTHVLFGRDTFPTQTVRAKTKIPTTAAVFDCEPSIVPEFQLNTRGILGTFDVNVRGTAEVPGGDTVSLMFFNQLHVSNTAASDAAKATFDLSNPPIGGDLLKGLAPAVLARVLNWDFRFGNFLATGPGPGTPPHVRVFAVDPATPATELGSFLAFGSNWLGGVRVASGDLDNDKLPEIVTAAGPGGGPHVRIWDVDTFTGKVTPTAGDFYAYDPAFAGGVNVAIADVDPTNPGEELITGAGPGGGPHVRVWKYSATTGLTAIDSGGFYAYDPSFRGGVYVAAGDVSQGSSVSSPDNLAKEIVTGADGGGGPHVKIFRMSSGVVEEQYLRPCPTCPTQSGFMAYDPAFRGGVYVAVGDLDKKGKAEIVTGAGPGGGPHVRAWRLGSVSDLSELSGFYAYDPLFPGGVSVAADDTNGDGRADIITGAGPGGGPHVETWLISDVGAPTLGASFYAYDPLFGGGVWVSGLLPTG